MELNNQLKMTKKKRRELRREEKFKIEEATGRNKKIKRFMVWMLTIVVIIGITLVLIVAVSRGNSKELGEYYPSQGREHIDIGASHPAYSSNPPTSGSHYAQPAAWGIYEKELPDEQLVHNLEHGGIWISYNNVATDTVTTIENLAKQYPDKLIVEPRAKDDAKVVLASWQYLLKLDAYDEATILSFIKANKDHSPEPDVQ